MPALLQRSCRFLPWTGQAATSGPAPCTGDLVRPPLRQWSYLLFAVSALIVLVAAMLAPYVYAEYQFDLHGQTPDVLPKPGAPVTGQWFDDYFVVQTLDPTTFAIGEPRYYQGNYSYLILGTQRAVLFDGGSGLRDIVPVARSLTKLPITVIPSHLHFDHVGALGRLDRTAMLDDPRLRVRANGSRLTLERYEYLGFADRRASLSFPVAEWWAADSSVELGGRSLQVLATPGHTPTSVSLYDASRRQAAARTSPLRDGCSRSPTQRHGFLQPIWRIPQSQ
jgi:hydroxyacylglutathione hydrolase